MNIKDYKTAGIVVAAGLSSRMGEFKPLMSLHNNLTIIETTIKSMLEAQVDYIILVLGYRGLEIEEMIKESPQIKIVYNLEYESTDMMNSIQIGLEQLQKYDTDAFYILPGDMPLLDFKTFIRLKEAFIDSNKKVIIPEYMGKRVHPPIFDISCEDYLLNFTKNGGLREAMKFFSDETLYLSIGDKGSLIDIDTIKDYGEALEYLKNNGISR